MRRALLVPLLLAAAALPAEAAFQGREECRRTIALEDGATLRLGFNTLPPETPAPEVRYESFSLWADGKELPAQVGRSRQTVIIDLEVPRTQEGESAELDYDVLVDAIRTDPTLESGYGAMPIRGGAAIAREAEACMARSSREQACSHTVRFDDGRSNSFEFRHGPPAESWPRADAPGVLAVSVRGSALPLAGTRRATIRFSRVVRERSPLAYVDLVSFVLALRASPVFELRNERGRVLRTISIPDAREVARHAEYCIRLRELGDR
jgi:hypothetical protein